MPPPTLARTLLDALADHGARVLFGIPGDFVVPLFREARRWGRLPLYGLTHEPAVGFAADAAARIGGGLGVALVTYGAGALNLVNPIANAYAEKTPLVVVSGAPGLAERRRHALIHHQVRSLASQANIMMELTVDQGILDDPETAPGIIARVLQSCRERSRPVYFEVPRDLMDQPSAPVVPLARSPVCEHDVTAAATATLARLASARSPILLVDIEVRRFGVEAAVAALAAHLDLPIITTISGRGLMAADPDLVVGTWMGAAGDPAIAARVADADLIIGLGVLHSDVNFGAADPIARARLVDARDGVVVHADQFFDAPLADYVAALCRLTGTPSPAQRAHAASVSARAAPSPAAPPAASLTCGDQPITSDDIALAVNDLFARSGSMPIVSDVGDCLFAAADITTADFLAPAFYATMGYAIPAALGVQAATGRRPLVLVGDGAFQMTGTELAAATPRRWDPIVIVFDNHGWEMVRRFDQDSPMNDLPPVDFALFARSLGGRGHTIRTRDELAAALAVAHAETGCFHVLHVHLAAGTASRALRRFAAAVGAHRD